MVASALEYELRHWSRLHPRHKLPRVVYVIPTGSNPSGTERALCWLVPALLL
jgi:DNA-binding transcriptional MocR family regulator